MRANSPVEDFGLLNPVEDEVAPINQVPEDVKKLAKAAQTKDGQIILDHLQKRVDDYMNTLKNSNFADNDPIQTAVSVMTAQAVIKEFEGVLRDVEVSKEAVKNAVQGT